MHFAAALQVEGVVQAAPGAHWAPTASGVWMTPSAASHVSVVHGLPSSTAGGAPETQARL